MSPETLQQTYDNNSQIRTAVNRLTELLEWLYPDPSPDIFTVRDYRNRYPFTRLGPLATGDIDRYQRINRAMGNHVQLGLCHYHIGLIYLHEGAFWGAVQQFELARQQWSFVNQPASISLTHLGRVVALQRADHYEAALVSVGKVASWLDRARFAETVPQWERFRAQVLAYVAELQAALRQQMDAAPQTAVSDPAQPDEANDSSGPAAGSPDQKTEPGVEAVVSEALPPVVNMDRAARPSIPIPEHLLMDDRYAWYLVEKRPSSNFLVEINAGDWLLVDLKPGFTEDLQDTEQPVLVVMDKQIEGTIRVRPLDPKERYQRIYLVTLADSSKKFQRDQVTGTVTFSPEMAEIGVDLSEILGSVVGFWRPMIELLPNG